MRVFYSDDVAALALENTVVTVGSYDGVHYGHRVLLAQVVSAAKKRNGESVVVTFWPHPRKVLPSGGNVKLLNTLPEKIMLLEAAGIDNLMVLPFTPELAALSSFEFVRDVLVGRLGMKEFVVGYNHHFGADRGGDYESLVSVQQEFGFKTHLVERNDVADQKVSSTIIRQMIEQGEMRRVAAFLTRGFVLIADVDARGMLVSIDTDKMLPPVGCYDVEVECDNELIAGKLHIYLERTVCLEADLRGQDNVVITFV